MKVRRQFERAREREKERGRSELLLQKVGSVDLTGRDRGVKVMSDLNARVQMQLSFTENLS